MSHERENPRWTLIRIESPIDLVDIVSEFCHDIGSLGLVIHESNNLKHTIEAYFDYDASDSLKPLADKFIEGLAYRNPLAEHITVETEPVYDENWAVAWKEFFKPTEIGNSLIITPPWINGPFKNRIDIVIEPAVAFGTGTHETTKTCLEFLENAASIIKSEKIDQNMLDVGCGSGILAIAGAKMGLSQCTAIDNDPLAVESTRKNCNINGVSHKVEILEGDIDRVEVAYSIVTANLDPMTLVPNRNKLISKTERFLIISGCPIDQWGDVKERFKGFSEINLTEKIGNEWATGMFEYKPDK